MPYRVTTHTGRPIQMDTYDGGRMYVEDGALYIEDDNDLIDAIFAAGEWVQVTWIGEDD